MATEVQVHTEIDTLFRTQSRSILARLVRLFGPENIDLAENVMQEALVTALKLWPLQGIPDNPAGWITQVAKNKALDVLRRNRFLCQDGDALDFPVSHNTERLKNEFLEDELRLLFLSCHPILAPESQVSLALKTICGFSVAEIGRAFFAKEETIAQRLVRAKQKIRAANLPYELPSLAELQERREAVLQTLYLMFNEGYAATAGETLIKRDVCYEAIRLVQRLLEHPVGQVPEAHALLALMLFQSSRFETRLDAHNDIVLLEDQDRARWDHSAIGLALTHLQKAAAGEVLTSYHIEAGIASCHATAPSYGKTDWEQILLYYDMLVEQKPSAVVLLNRAVAASMIRGPEFGFSEVDKLKSSPEFSTSMIFPATVADFYRRMQRHHEALAQYQKALLLAQTEPEQNFLTKRIKEMEDFLSKGIKQ